MRSREYAASDPKLVRNWSSRSRRKQEAERNLPVAEGCESLPQERLHHLPVGDARDFVDAAREIAMIVARISFGGLVLIFKDGGGAYDQPAIVADRNGAGAHGHFVAVLVVQESNRF